MNRRTVVTSCLLAPVSVKAWARPCVTARVLFVCPAGSVKSAIAREQLRRMAKAQGISLVVESRGINPEDHISPLLADRLKQDGIDPRNEPLRRFTPEDAKKADIVIAFDEAADAPGLEGARRWRVASWNTQFDDAKSDTLENEARLLKELGGQACRFSREPGARQ